MTINGFLLGAALALLPVATSSAQSGAEPFRSSPSVVEVRQQIEKLPRDDVWDNDNFYKGGWAGQGLLINPRRDLVAVYTGYFKDDQYSELDLLPRLRKVLDGVYGNSDGQD